MNPSPWHKRFLPAAIAIITAVSIGGALVAHATTDGSGQPGTEYPHYSSN